MLNDDRNFRPPIAPLFVPGDRPERFIKALNSGADAVIFDLEDAVAAERKGLARDAIDAHFRDLAAVPQKEMPRLVRINARMSRHFQADLDALQGWPVAAVLLAKTEHADDIAAFCESSARPVPIIALIESVKGLAQLPAILACAPVCAVGFGSLDFALDLGCQHLWDALLLARSELVLRSRLANRAAPLDGVTPVFDDAVLIEAEARRAAELGFGGKLAIHPRQIEPIQRAFSPDVRTVAWARKVLETAQDDSAIQVDGAMVDLPVIERARRVLASIASRYE